MAFNLFIDSFYQMLFSMTRADFIAYLKAGIDSTLDGYLSDIIVNGLGNLPILLACGLFIVICVIFCRFLLRVFKL